MAGTIQVALLTLLAVLVGALIPLLVSGRGLITQARRTIERIDENSVETLTQVRQTLERLDRVVITLEEGRPAIGRTLERLDTLSDSLERMQNRIRTASAVGAAVGPAIAAAVRAYRASNTSRSEPSADEAAEEVLAGLELEHLEQSGPRPEEEETS